MRLQFFRYKTNIFRIFYKLFYYKVNDKVKVEDERTAKTIK